MKIELVDLWCTQRFLNPTKIEFLRSLDSFQTKIVLHRCEDEEIQINDGHHRVACIWLNGRVQLEEYEFVICDVEDKISRNRMSIKILDLIRKYL